MFSSLKYIYSQLKTFRKSLHVRKDVNDPGIYKLPDNIVSYFCASAVVCMFEKNGFI